MAYNSTTFPPILMNQGVAHVPKTFYYTNGSATADSDTIGTINGSGYFSDGVLFGMQVGDYVWVTTWATAANTGHIVTVTAVSGNAATTTLVSGTT